MSVFSDPLSASVQTSQPHFPFGSPHDAELPNPLQVLVVTGMVTSKVMSDTHV